MLAAARSAPSLAAGESADSEPRSPPRRAPRVAPSPSEGAVKVHNRGLFEAQVRSQLTPLGEASTPAGTPARPRRLSAASTGRPPSVRSTGRSPGASSKRDGEKGDRGSPNGRVKIVDGSPRGGAAAHGRPPRERYHLVNTIKGEAEDAQQRKSAEVISKWQKTEAMREADGKQIRERVIRNHEEREQRFHQMMESIMSGGDGLAQQTDNCLQARAEMERRRGRALHAQWEEKIGDHLAAQARDRLNPPDRTSDVQHVAFTMPDMTPRLFVSPSADPVKKALTEHAKENAFMKAAANVLTRSRSTPDLRSALRGADGTVARAMTKATLDPVSWGQVEIQGTMFGQIAQATASSPSCAHGRRRGQSVFIPDEGDGVLVAGTRRSRAEGYHSKGILQGQRGSQGEAAELKTPWGGGSCAPMQDHYHFSDSRQVVDLEFPLGRRTFAEQVH